MKTFTKKSLVVSLLTSFIGLSTGLLSNLAHAGSINSNFQTSASLASTCVLSATNVAFGAITPAATGSNNATGTITSTCTKATTYSLAINAGGSGSISARTISGTIAGNTDKVAYNLYTDSVHTTLFGDGSLFSGSVVQLTGSGSAQITSVYGNLLLNQYITPDNYSDNLTVTLSY